MDVKTQFQIWIEQKQARIDNGTITNSKTLKFAKRDIKRWKIKIENM